MGALLHWRLVQGVSLAALDMGAMQAVGKAAAPWPRAVVDLPALAVSAVLGGRAGMSTDSTRGGPWDARSPLLPCSAPYKSNAAGFAAHLLQGAHQQQQRPWHLPQPAPQSTPLPAPTLRAQAGPVGGAAPAAPFARLHPTPATAGALLLRHSLVPSKHQQRLAPWGPSKPAGFIPSPPHCLISPCVTLHRHYASAAPPPAPQSWLQRARAAVAQPRSLAAGASDRGAAAFDSVTGAGARYRHALGLQLASFWNRNSLLLYGALGLAVVLVLWRVMFGIASLFLNFSEWMADLGFLALASSMVILAGLYLRRRYMINPDSVYRQVMRQVNTFPAALEVLGAPLTGSDVRAYVMSGGSVRIRGLTPKLTRKRAYLIFPVRGSERRGLVSVEAKKRHGKYEFKLISVDVPTASGSAEQRLYLVGDEAAYQKAGHLINELRDPIIKAMAMEHQFEDEDDKEDEEEAKQLREKEAQQFQDKLTKEAAQLQAEAEAQDQEHAAKAQAKV